MVQRSQQRYEQVEQAFKAPLLFLSFLLIPLLGIPAVFEVSPSTTRDLEIIASIIWLTFVVEYVTLLVLAPDRKEMVRTHKMDLLLIVLPILRPLQILRAVVGIGAVFRLAQRLLGRRGLGWSILVVFGLIVIGGSVVTAIEDDVAGSNITTIGDGLWWAVVTCTTVGYGDHFPVTNSGRLIAIVLMITGIGLLGLVTANISAWFLEDDDDTDIARLQDEIAALHTKLDQILTQTAAGAGASPTTGLTTGPLETDR